MKALGILFSLALAATGAVAADPAPSGPAGAIQYRPPLRGAPAVRIGGATRSLVRAAPAVTYVAPDHVGLSLRTEPTLYWNAAEVPGAAMLFRLTPMDGSSAVIERVLPAGPCTGLHRVRLGDLGIAIRAEVDYRWQVVSADEQGRAPPISGWLRLGDAIPGFADRLHRAALDERARMLAEAGVWYDAVHELMSQTASAEAAVALGSLLEQGGMPSGIAEAPHCFP